MTPRHVVVINDIAQPKGGATALALASALALRDRGLEVSYISGDNGKNERLSAAGIEITALGQDRLTSTSAVRALANGLFNRAAAAMVREWIARFDRPDTVYHVHGWSQILSPAIFGALAPVRDRLVLSAHDFFLACPNGSFAWLRTGEVCPYKPLSVQCIAKNCDRRNYAHKLWRVARQVLLRMTNPPGAAVPILAIHEAMLPFLARAGFPNTALRTLRNPVVPFTAERIEAERNRQILYVGRLEATKGPDLAAEAARQAGAQIVFVGDGELRAGLEAKYHEMVFLGHQPPDRIAEHARNARLLVMPSRYPEPFGLVAVEALWSGLPVVLTETALLAPEIEAAGAGLGVDVRDTARFAAILRELLEDDARIAAMSAAAFTGLPGIALRPEAWTDGLIDAYRAALTGSTLTAASA